MTRRLQRFVWGLCFSLLMTGVQAMERISVAYPGPFNLSYLPLDLAPRIGADRAEGIELVVRHTAGGGLALQHLQRRNVDFAVAGVPAAMSARANGNDVVVIAAVNDLPLFMLMVRADLKGVVQRPRDLAGRVVGVNASALSAKTTSQQLAELLVQNDGLSPHRIRIVAAGQSWEEQSALIRSRYADAIVGDEPFVTRLVNRGEVFVLTSLANPADIARIPGAGFLHAALETRSDVLRNSPRRAEKMVAVLRRTLQWMARHSPEETVTALGIDDAEARAALIDALRRYPRAFSPDGAFSARQITETDRFYAVTEGRTRPLKLETMLDDRFVTRRP